MSLGVVSCWKGALALFFISLILVISGINHVGTGLGAEDEVQNKLDATVTVCCQSGAIAEEGVLPAGILGAIDENKLETPNETPLGNVRVIADGAQFRNPMGTDVTYTKPLEIGDYRDPEGLDFVSNSRLEVGYFKDPLDSYDAAEPIVIGDVVRPLE